jgi:hypothetical protein
MYPLPSNLTKLADSIQGKERRTKPVSDSSTNLSPSKLSGYLEDINKELRVALLTEDDILKLDLMIGRSEFMVGL